MAELAGVRFTEAGPISYCSAGDLALGVGDYVVVSGERGERLGWVVIAPDQVLSGTPPGPLRVIDRIATEEDVGAWREARERAEEDRGRAQDLAARSDPRVRVASLDYDLAGDYCEITFAASERVEHAWLVRQARELLGCDVRVEQVGDRDRAKAAGGLGVCGLALCCSTWQTEFPSISIKMAKEQDLAPNPSKISGVCGRLLCCLSFEVESYRELRGDLPKVGRRVSTPAGNARVISVNALSQLVRMRMESGQIIDIPADELRAQYGTAVRPVDVQDEVEAPIRDRDRALHDALLARLTPVDQPAFAPERPTQRTPRRTPERAGERSPRRGGEPGEPGEGGGRRSDGGGGRSRGGSAGRAGAGAGAGESRGDGRGERGADGGRPVRTSRRRPGEPREGAPTTGRGPRAEAEGARGPRGEAEGARGPHGEAGRPGGDAGATGGPAGGDATDGGEGERKRRRRGRGRRRPEGEGGAAPEQGGGAGGE